VTGRHVRLVAWALAALGLVVVIGLAAFLSDSESPRTIDEAEAKRALAQLPYEIEFRPVRPPPGANGAVAGRVFGPGGTTFRFGVSLGPGAEPVKLGRGVESGGGEAFRVSDDATILVDGRPQIAPRLRSEDQWREAARIVVDIEEQLCRATTGRSCAI
jgi:hypothetical protein